MKKVFILLMAISLMFSFNSCDWFKQKNENKKEIVVENLVSEDTKYMVENYDTCFVYYETQIVLNNYLDEECDGSFESVRNIFQGYTLVDSTFQPTVVIFEHIGDSSSIEKVNDIWMEDMVMTKDDIAISYKEAFKYMNEVNYPKPHAKACVLRKEVGPCEANAQYIFGNIESQLYVDAITGDVSTNSPSFSCLGAEENVEEAVE